MLTYCTLTAALVTMKPKVRVNGVIGAVNQERELGNEQVLYYGMLLECVGNVL